MNTIDREGTSIIGKSGTGVVWGRLALMAFVMLVGSTAVASESSASSITIEHADGYEITVEFDSVILDEALAASEFGAVTHTFAIYATETDAGLLVHGSGTGASVQVHGSGTGASTQVHGSGTGAPLSSEESFEVWGLAELLISDSGHLLIVHSFEAGKLDEVAMLMLETTDDSSLAVD